MDQTTKFSPMQAARLRKGWTQRQLAAACKAAGRNADHGQIGRIERGEAAPDPALRKVLAEVLALDPLIDLPPPAGRS